MGKENLILEDSFSTHQKIHIFALASPILALVIELTEIQLNSIGVLFLLLFLFIFIVIMCFAFSKKGFVKREGKLFKARFFRGKILSRKSINLVDRPVVSILKFKRSRKYAFFSAAKPDLASTFNSFEVYVLNERHIKRDLLMRLTLEENAMEAVKFLCEDLLLRHEIYSPNFGYARVPARS